MSMHSERDGEIYEVGRLDGVRKAIRLCAETVLVLRSEEEELNKKISERWVKNIEERTTVLVSKGENDYGY